VTQCEHCRELRKTKQVHVKCICGGQESSDSLTGGPIKKGLPCFYKIVYGWLTQKTAALALQERTKCQRAPPSRTVYLEISRHRSHYNCYRKDCLILIVVRRGFTSQSSYAVLTSGTGEHSSANSCSCKAGGACHCCTPRISAPRRRNTGDRRSDEERDNYKGPDPKRNHRTSEFSSPLSSQVLARIAELRPVLPRPSNRPAWSSHDPSSTVAHNHAIRHYSRDNVMFSPYGRAYDMSHSFENPRPRHDTPQQGSAQDIRQDLASFHRTNGFSNQQSLDIPPNVESWVSTGDSFPSTCNCGDGCACPGCVEHNGGRATVPGTSAFSSCANPGECSHCLDCTILSLPVTFPPDNALSIYDSQSQSIDEWIRQISAQSNPMSDSAPPSLTPDLGMAAAYAPPAWNDVQLPRFSESTRNCPSSECCKEQCKCPSGLCTCPGNCDCRECAEHEHHDDFVARTSGLTFATSGERGSCPSGGNGRGIRSLESFERGSRLNLGPNINQGLLDIPDLSRSRSSSTSSQSIPESGYSTDLSTMFTTRPIVTRGLPSSGSSSSASSAGQRRTAGSSNVSSHTQTPDNLGIVPNSSATYAINNPDSEGSGDHRFEAYSQYNPSLDRMHL